MVNQNTVRKMSYTIEDVLTENQLRHIAELWMKDHNMNSAEWSLKGSDIKPATEGLTGFLGDHLRVTLHLKRDNSVQKILLFIKSLPISNKPKANFINESNFYRREMVMYKLFEEMGGSDGPERWHPKAYLCNEFLVVMPDLCAEGYTLHCPLLTLDMDHILVTATSMARFHATFANYETRKSLEKQQPYNINQDYGDIIAECNFKDSPWLRAVAKLNANFLDEFSTKIKVFEDLEAKLYDLYLEACNHVKDYEDTLNVLIHKDLWSNNIMFSYSDKKPKNALLVDFQCLRYAPPGYDMMIFLYLNTDAKFRREQEKNIMKHYFTVFEKTVDENTKKRLQNLGYDYEEFCDWCEKGRMFGLLEAVAIFPYTLMDPACAEKIFDDANTFDEYTNVDRTKPVVEHAYQVPVYKQRILEVYEEFVERYVKDE